MSENTKVEQYDSQVKSSLALKGEDEVSYEPFTWVRSLKIGRGWFVENTSPLGENAKVEQYGSPIKSSLTLRGEDEVSYEPFVPTRPRALTKVNTWWDPSRAHGDEKGDGHASGVDRPWVFTSLGR